MVGWSRDSEENGPGELYRVGQRAGQVAKHRHWTTGNNSTVLEITVSVSLVSTLMLPRKFQDPVVLALS